MLRIKVAVSLACCLWLLQGCNEPRLQQPEVTLQNLRVTKLNFLRGDGVIVLRVSNPNPDPLHLEGVRVALACRKESFAKGMVPANRQIPAYGHIDLEIPGSFSNLMLLRMAGKTFQLRESITYGMDVTMTVKDSGGARHTLTAHKGGTVPIGLPNLPRHQLQQLFQTDAKELLKSLK